MFENCVSYDNESMTAAIENIQKFDSDYEGTKIYEPLKHILS